MRAHTKNTASASEKWEERSRAQCENVKMQYMTVLTTFTAPFILPSYESQ